MTAHGTDVSTEQRAMYRDETDVPQPSWQRIIGSGDVSVYGDHLIGSFKDDTGGDINLEVRGGRLFLYAFGPGEDDGGSVEFSMEESRALLRAASHMLVSNTMAAVKVLDAEPEMRKGDHA